jgi:hypothetical protein
MNANVREGPKKDQSCGKGKRGIVAVPMLPRLLARPKQRLLNPLMVAADYLEGDDK